MDLDRIHIAILVIGVLFLLEAIWALAAPTNFQSVVEWFTRASKRLYSCMGIIFIAVGLFFWVLVILGEPFSHWVLTILAFLLIAKGFLWFRPQAIKTFANTCVLKRSSGMIRLIYVVVLLFGCCFVWIALSTN